MNVCKSIKVFLLFLMIFVFTLGCNSESNSIEGYWLSETGSEISFASDGKGTLDGVTIEYSTLDEDTIKLSFLFVEEFYYYTLEGDTLVLEHTTDRTKDTFYRGKEKHIEIRENFANAQSGNTEKWTGDIVLYDNDSLADDVDNWDIVEKIADNQILSLYESVYSNTDYGYFYEKSVNIDGDSCEELRFFESYPERDRYFASYAICPADGTIYVDDYIGNGYILWDGKTLY